MYRHTFRNSVVEGSITLPFMAILTTVLWFFSPGEGWMMWLTMAIIAVMTYIIVEWNNQCQLLRIRSRMNSAVFLALIAGFPAIHSDPLAIVPAFFLLVCFFILCKSYGLYEPQGYAFHGFFSVSLASLLFPPILLCIPFLLFSCNYQLRILQRKTFVACILGLVLPYWIYIPVSALLPTFDPWQRWKECFQIALPDYSNFPLWQWAALGFMLLMAVVAMTHFVRNSYNDKIKTRQFFYTVLAQEIPVIALTLWFPQYFSICFPMLIVCTTPFIAHYLALGKSRWMNYWFYFWVLLIVTLGFFNYLNIWKFFIN